MTRHDTYTGGEHHWIRFYDGTHEVRKEGYSHNETVFTGHYEQCLKWLENKVAEDLEYNLNI